MTDRADEIAQRVQSNIVQYWDTDPELALRRVTDCIRAYGDECREEGRREAANHAEAKRGFETEAKHHFTPSPDNDRFCNRCDRYLTDDIHIRALKEPKP